MNKMAWPALAGLLLYGATSHVPIVAAGETIAVPTPTPTWYLFCTAAQPKRELEDETVIPDAIYYSGAFTVTMKDLSPVNEAFVKFLQEQHGYVIDPSLAQPVMCHNLPTLAKAQEDQQSYLNQSKRYSDRQQVIETGWTYSAP